MCVSCLLLLLLLYSFGLCILLVLIKWMMYNVSSNPAHLFVDSWSMNSEEAFSPTWSLLGMAENQGYYQSFLMGKKRFSYWISKHCAVDCWVIFGLPQPSSNLWAAAMGRFNELLRSVSMGVARLSTCTDFHVLCLYQWLDIHENAAWLFARSEMKLYLLICCDAGLASWVAFSLVPRRPSLPWRHGACALHVLRQITLRTRR